MASVNKVILIGHLGRDPEVRNTQDGMKIVNISLATSESWNDKHSGQRQERTEWHRVVVLNEHLAGIAEQYLKKGSRIYVEGSLATRKWTDQSGVKKYTTEIILGRIKSTLTILDSHNEGDGAARPQQRASGAGGGRSSGGNTTWGANPQDDLDDEIPF